MTEFDKSLKEYNTFGLDCTAREYLELHDESDFEYVCKKYAERGALLVLGGGSNTVFTNRVFEGCVLRVCNRGISVVKEDDTQVIVRAAAGEVWREFVLWCCQRGYCGLENLAAIYGTVGASPVQNIGAYGVQVADLIEEVEYLDMSCGAKKRIKAADCEFDYRFSRWKKANKNELIYSVSFRLQKEFVPNLSYAAVANNMSEKERETLTPLAMCNLITKVRNSKLPDVATLGNVGSFFKNPVVSKEQFETLKAKDASIVSFDDKNGVKLSAAWLIEHCGFKGKRFGNVGMHEKQALVLVNYGGASGKEIVDFARLVKETVLQNYGVKLEIEAHLV